MRYSWQRWMVLLVVVAVGLTACSMQLERTLWVLQSYGEVGHEKSVLQGTEITAAFDGTQVSGSAGCNSYFGAYEAGGTKLSISNLAWTEMACARPVMEQEQEYLTALEGAESYWVFGDKLRVSCSGGWVLQFAARR